jgi:putative tryptophan/tyrosine transport system permease protein
VSDLVFFLDGVFYNSTGLLFVAVGIMVLIRHTGFPDLTVDGSFTIGAAIFALLFAHGVEFIFAFGAALAAGSLAGLLTAFANQVLGISKVVASVLSMTILILSAPYITGGATIGLLQTHGLQAMVQGIDVELSRTFASDHVYVHFATSALWLVLGVACAAVLYFFLRTRLGTALRYIGSAENPAFVGGRSARRLTVLGLAVGNALVAGGGAIESLRRGAYTANMGLGTLLLGLTIVILGEAVMKTFRQRDFLTLPEQFVGIAVGLLLYSVLLQGILSAGLSFIDLKLATTILLLLLLGIAGRFFPNSRRLF